MSTTIPGSPSVAASLGADPVSLWPETGGLGAVTDLYQVSMMAGYFASGRAAERATFEAFVRRLPPHRNFLVFAGLEQALCDLGSLQFTSEQVDWLGTLPGFVRQPPAFFEFLRTIRFTGNVWAVPEGTVVFAGEPVLRVEAPLAEAQWVETFLLASLGYPTLVASKAARIVHAAVGRPVLDFGLRRGHGLHAGMIAARSAYLAGFAATSNLEAARRLGIPASGTMAHSWCQSFPTERQAFEVFARTFPDQTTLLVDTYDPLDGVRLAAAVEPRVGAVRIDSGDPLELSRRARAILDDLGRSDVRIVATGDLDENEIARLVAAGAPIDAFGIGTELVTSRDAPALALVYKLVAIEGRGTAKLSVGKASYPLAKQVYRSRTADGHLEHDLITAADEPGEGEALLTQVVAGGRIVGGLPKLDAIRSHCRSQVASLAAPLRSLGAAVPFPVAYSARLNHELARLAEGPHDVRGPSGRTGPTRSD